MKRHAPCAGFSLIELLVCTLIMGVLYAIYFGAGSQGYELRERARCAQNLQQMALVLGLYAQEHDGAFPAVEGAQTPDLPLSLLVPQYTTDTSVFICPASKNSSLPKAVPFAGHAISYAYYSGVHTGPRAATTLLVTDSQIDAAPKLAGEPLFAEKHVAPGGNHRQWGGNLLYADGHVETATNRAAADMSPGAGVTLLNPQP